MHCHVYVNIILMLKIDRIGVQPLILLTIDDELFKHLQYSRYYLISFFKSHIWAEFAEPISSISSEK